MLAKEIRKLILELRAGERIEDLLHKSNPWEGSNCGRQNCFPVRLPVKMKNVYLKAVLGALLFIKLGVKHAEMLRKNR